MMLFELDLFIFFLLNFWFEFPLQRNLFKRKNAIWPKLSTASLDFLIQVHVLQKLKNAIKLQYLVKLYIYDLHMKSLQLEVIKWPNRMNYQTINHDILNMNWNVEKFHHNPWQRKIEMIDKWMNVTVRTCLWFSCSGQLTWFNNFFYSTIASLFTLPFLILALLRVMVVSLVRRVMIRGSVEDLLAASSSELSSSTSSTAS